MEESSTYQLTLRKGAVRTRQADVLLILSERFGAIPPEVELRVRSESDLQRLQDALRHAIRVRSLAEFEL